MSKVSIVMPCYNDGLYIKESIASVKAQTYKNIELIIVDDGSDDPHTLEVIKQLSEEDIHLVRIKNSGPAEARNIGIASAKGDYILPLDSDDTISATYVEKAVKVLDSEKNVGVVYCYADLFGEKSGKWELPDYSLEKMLLDNIVFVTAMFRKKDWETVGGFNTSMEHGMEDYDFWLSLLEIDKDIFQIKEVLFHYRIKTHSRTTNFQTNSLIVQQTYSDIYKQHPKLYEKFKDEYAKVLRNALIEQLFLNRALQESIGILEKIKKIPILKTIVKKMVMK